MTASLFSLSQKAIDEMNKGEYDQLFIEGMSGYILIRPVGSDSILVVCSTKDVHFCVGFFDYFLLPYIYNPPEPPDDIDPALQSQRKVIKEKEEPKPGFDCPYCGHKLPKGQKHCPICGKDVF